MPKISQNLRERAIGYAMNAVTMNIECPSCAIRLLRQYFQVTGCTEARPLYSELPQLLLLAPLHLSV
jgi:hypothetical protein